MQFGKKLMEIEGLVLDDRSTKGKVQFLPVNIFPDCARKSVRLSTYISFCTTVLYLVVHRFPIFQSLLYQCYITLSQKLMVIYLPLHQKNYIWILVFYGCNPLCKGCVTSDFTSLLQFTVQRFQSSIGVT